MLAKLGDSVTTDHISPGRLDQGRLARPGGTWPSTASSARDFNSYGSRRGNHEVMIRGTFANIRLRNQLVPGVEGGVHRQPARPASRPPSTTPRQPTREAGVPLVVLAGKEYGSGSSRDWAAKGTALLGVRAVIAESYERIHRSNLIGMGVLPLQYPDGETAESLGLTGDETFSITGVDGAERRRRTPRTVEVTAPTTASEFDGRACASTPPARRTTTATAASCSTCCAPCSADPPPSRPVGGTP